MPYVFRDLPEPLWSRVKYHAARHGRGLRAFILRALATEVAQCDVAEQIGRMHERYDTRNNEVRHPRQRGVIVGITE